MRQARASHVLATHRCVFFRSGVAFLAALQVFSWNIYVLVGGAQREAWGRFLGMQVMDGGWLHTGPQLTRYVHTVVI